MIAIGGVDGRRVSNSAIVAILVLVAFDTGRMLWRQHVQMRQEIRERIEELTQVCEQISKEP